MKDGLQTRPMPEMTADPDLGADRARLYRGVTFPPAAAYAQPFAEWPELNTAHDAGYIKEDSRRSHNVLVRVANRLNALDPAFCAWADWNDKAGSNLTLIAPDGQVWNVGDITGPWGFDAFVDDQCYGWGVFEGLEFGDESSTWTDEDLYTALLTEINSRRFSLPADEQKDKRDEAAAKERAAEGRAAFLKDLKGSTP